MSKFGGSDYILAVQDRKADGQVGRDKPAVTPVSKQVITDSAISYANVKNIPLGNRFSTRKSETTNAAWKPFKYGWDGNPNSGLFSTVTAQSFARVTERDKLFIFAHGNNVGIAWMADDREMAQASMDNARLLAKFLLDAGLRTVGLITFKACLVGKGDFLKKFAIALAGQGIRAGWLKGYKGLAATVEKEGGGVTEKVTFKGVTLVSEGQDVVNNARYRIVRGPGRLFEGSSEFGRYQGTTSEAEAEAFGGMLFDS